MKVETNIHKSNPTPEEVLKAQHDNEKQVKLLAKKRHIEMLSNTNQQIDM